MLTLRAGGAKLRLAPWDGSIFTAKLMPLDKFAAVAEDLGPMPNAFVQFQMDKEAELNVLRLSFDDGQAYDLPASSHPAPANQAASANCRGR